MSCLVIYVFLVLFNKIVFFPTLEMGLNVEFMFLWLLRKPAASGHIGAGEGSRSVIPEAENLENQAQTFSILPRSYDDDNGHPKTPEKPGPEVFRLGDDNTIQLTLMDLFFCGGFSMSKLNFPH